MGNYRNANTSVLLFLTPELTFLLPLRIATVLQSIPITKIKQKTKLGNQAARLEPERKDEGEEAGLGSRHASLSTLAFPPTSKLVFADHVFCCTAAEPGVINHFWAWRRQSA